MQEFEPILLKLDKLISLSRLNELAFIMGTDLTERVSKLAVVLNQLIPGAYLLGTGPSTVGIIHLSVDEVILGRSATILEEPSDTIIDFTVADTIFFTPREVSKVHAKIERKMSESNTHFFIKDLESSCGTFVNGSRIEFDEDGIRLSHGDIVSLGPSMISAYVFYVA